jgi:hypothetical protein
MELQAWNLQVIICNNLPALYQWYMTFMSQTACYISLCTKHYKNVPCKYIIFTKDQNQLAAHYSIVICSYISNMFLPDLLANLRESHAAMFQLRIVQCGYKCLVCCLYTA